MDEVGLKRAAAQAVVHNAPLGPEREAELTTWLIEAGTATVVDLGCGRGELLRRVLAAAPEATGVGVDNDPWVLERARASTTTDRLTFELAEAATWRGQADAAICVGASHAFGNAGSMFVRLSEITERAIVGDGCWWREPDAWSAEVFGDLPRSPAALVDLAERSGWRVEHVDVSTLDEWDAFERDWTDGVEAVGTGDAAAFAAQRRADYLRYRGVLAFAWLRVTP